MLRFFSLIYNKLISVIYYFSLLVEKMRKNIQRWDVTVSHKDWTIVHEKMDPEYEKRLLRQQNGSPYSSVSKNCQL
jgi:hypothetical protein